nr:GDP-mannose 4,6-dehydratase [Thermoplasma sp. Kam2015]
MIAFLFICKCFLPWKYAVYHKLTYAGRMENLKGVECDFIKGDVASPFLGEIVERYRLDTVVNFAAESHVDR